MDRYKKIIEEALFDYLEKADGCGTELVNSMRYSVKAGGKRLRPSLILAFCEAFGGDIKVAIPFACALEMIHTYSLIHDDLPCMDNDDFRRGRPSNHVEFGESTALLAGDTLLTLAFEIMLSDRTIALAGEEKAARAAGALARAAGIGGMCMGQALDLQTDGCAPDISALVKRHGMKTGALISAACVMGCILAGANDKIKLAQSYGMKIGLAFQINDDILDATSTTEELGKPVGSDEANSKPTFITLLGQEQSKSFAKKLTEEAIEILFQLDGDTEFLIKITKDLLYRKN